MPTWKEGDRVRVVTREVTEDDRKTSRYYSHMAGLVGSVESVFSDDRVSVKVDLTTAPETTRSVHKAATERIRKIDVPQGFRRALTEAEQNFTPNFVVLVESGDLEKA